MPKEGLTKIRAGETPLFFMEIVEMRPTLHQDFQKSLDEIINSKGKLTFPNVKLIEDPNEALSAICWADFYAKPYHLKIASEYFWYPKIYVNRRGMGSGFDGSGIILGRINGKPRAYTFAMCEHEWNDSGANHRRGWHPLVCTKCGFDASIDSGD